MKSVYDFVVTPVGERYNNTKKVEGDGSGGDIIIQNTANDKDIVLESDNGSGGTAAYLILDGSTGWTTVHTPLELVVTPEPENPEAGSAVIWMEESGSIYAKITVEETTAIVVVAEFVEG